MLIVPCPGWVPFPGSGIPNATKMMLATRMNQIWQTDTKLNSLQTIDRSPIVTYIEWLEHCSLFVNNLFYFIFKLLNSYRRTTISEQLNASCTPMHYIYRNNLCICIVLDKENIECLSCNNIGFFHKSKSKVRYIHQKSNVIFHICHSDRVGGTWRHDTEQPVCNQLCMHNVLLTVVRCWWQCIERSASQLINTEINWNSILVI